MVIFCRHTWFIWWNGKGCQHRSSKYQCHTNSSSNHSICMCVCLCITKPLQHYWTYLPNVGENMNLIPTFNDGSCLCDLPETIRITVPYAKDNPLVMVCLCWGVSKYHHLLWTDHTRVTWQQRTYTDIFGCIHSASGFTILIRYFVIQY